MTDGSGTGPVPVETLVSVVRKWTRGFLRSELELAIQSEKVKLDRLQRIDLRDVTSIVSVGGSVNMFIAFSFDMPLLEHVTGVLTEGLDVDDLEPAALQEDAAAEVINTIVGNSTSDFEGQGTAITLSPPVTLAGAKSVFRSREAIFCTVALTTGEGTLDVDFIGPREVFDWELNYLGEAG